jgi:cellulose synthase operon protein YhjQ
MKIIPLVSYKGGVGKTTLTANLAVHLQALGWSVLVIDLDPQNALRLHFGMAADDPRGLAQQILSGSAWQDALMSDQSGVHVLPYGTLSEQERMQYEHLLAEHPEGLGDLLRTNIPNTYDVVLWDTPPGPSVYMQQVLSIAQRVLVVMYADPGSFATLPAMVSLLAQYCNDRADFLGANYLLNHVDGSKRLNMDVLNVMRRGLAGRLLPHVIHDDMAFTEAFACQRTVDNYDQYSQAAHDVQQVAQWLSQQLKSEMVDVSAPARA